jgi:hypothetical protein
MTASTSNLDTRFGHGSILLVRRLALGAGSLLRAIGSRWHDIVEAGQLGPDGPSAISRHTGARI